MRIQPPEIDIPKDDPFKNDLLGRRETVEVLTGIVRSIEGPCVLSVDAAWGVGKTTFLKIWAQHLRNQEFPIVEFNAWETDFSEEPFIALSTELTEGLRKYADESVTEKIDDMKSKMKEVARSLIPGLIRVAAAGIPLAGGVVGESLAALAEERLNAYEEARKSVEMFRTTLQDMANTLSISRGGRPLVVLIDELDRCRPSYAVELLEVAKHIFAVDHVIFVLGVNRSELAHSVNALYGAEFDALGYLGRFFDLEFRLPEPDRSAFVDSMMKQVGIIARFNRISWDDEERRTHNLLQEFLVKLNLSLREIGQAIHRLGLVFAAIPRNLQIYPQMTAVMFILRTVNTDLYYRFVDGEASDLDVVDEVFSRPGIKTLQQTPTGQLFEKMIIVAVVERLGELNEGELTFDNSPLLARYRGNSVGAESSEKEHARKIVAEIDAISPHATGNAGFKQAVEQIELISTVLIEQKKSPLGYTARLSKATGAASTQDLPKDTS